MLVASRPDTRPEPRTCSNERIAVSLSPAAVAALPRIWAIRKFSYGVRLPTASALATSASASRPLRCLTRAWAACSGLPTSGRTASPFCAWATPASPLKPANRIAATTGRRRLVRSMSCGSWLVEELLGPDEAHLGDAQALRRGHHSCDMLVGHKFVRAQVEFGLHRLGRGAGEALLQGRPVGNDVAVPDDGAVEIDLDGDHFGRRGRRGRVAHRHVELHGVRRP